MKLAELIKQGETVELRIGRIVAKTTLRDLLGNKLFIVDQPEYRMRPFVVAQDERVKVSFFRSNGVFSLTAAVEEVFVRNGLSQCLLRVYGEIEREQRRYFTRLPVDMGVLVRTKRQELSKNAVSHSAHAVNLSERGICFTCREKLLRGKRINVQMDLDEMGVLVLPAEVLRSEPLDRRDGVYTIGAQFTDLSMQEAACIRKFIMKRQMRKPEHE